jgi:hypothetical protein
MIILLADDKVDRDCERQEIASWMLEIFYAEWQISWAAGAGQRLLLAHSKEL